MKPQRAARSGRFDPPLAERLLPTRVFGDADMPRRILVLAWHQVTAALVCSAAAMLLLAFGILTSGHLPLFVSGLHAGFLGVGLWVVGGRFGELLQPVPTTWLG
jgi:hypothetical protein